MTMIVLLWGLLECTKSCHSCCLVISTFCNCHCLTLFIYALVVALSDAVNWWCAISITSVAGQKVQEDNKRAKNHRITESFFSGALCKLRNCRVKNCRIFRWWGSLMLRCSTLSRLYLSVESAIKYLFLSLWNLFRASKHYGNEFSAFGSSLGDSTQYTDSVTVTEPPFKLMGSAQCYGWLEHFDWNILNLV